jgi:hypothetical protein
MDEISFEPGPVTRSRGGACLMGGPKWFKGSVKHVLLEGWRAERCCRHLMESPVLHRGPQGGAFSLAPRFAARGRLAHRRPPFDVDHPIIAQGELASHLESRFTATAALSCCRVGAGVGTRGRARET